LTDGSVFDSSAGREPLEFVVGTGQMIPGFDSGVVGMEVGEVKTLRLPPEEAYGVRDEDMLFRLPRSLLPKGYTPVVGEVLQMSSRDGVPMRVSIREIEGDQILLDANHFLAGKSLIFDVTLVEIVK
jgi:peptidylprolyl isomerase